jgi:hypothetical protein
MQVDQTGDVKEVRIINMGGTGRINENEKE